MITDIGFDAEEAGHGVGLQELVNHLVEVEIAEIIGVVGEKHFLISNEPPNVSQPPADVGPQTRIGERDPPVLDVLVDQVELGPPSVRTKSFDRHSL